MANTLRMLLLLIPLLSAAAAFNSNDYPRSQKLHANMNIFWKTTADSIYLAIQVNLIKVDCSRPFQTTLD